jgi:hypothetical protein
LFQTKDILFKRRWLSPTEIYFLLLLKLLTNFYYQSFQLFQYIIHPYSQFLINPGTHPVPRLLIHHYNFRWYVDSIPIRVFRNYENEGIAYPSKQGMKVYSSLWNADNWATRGGLEKINWTCSPFTARLSQFRPRACEWKGPISISQCASETNPANWWTSPIYKQLGYAKSGQLQWVQDNYMIYNYCTDYKRFNGQMAPECSKPQF